jgi:CO/xanthine dehydrogenase Mo-binding subunit
MITVFTGKVELGTGTRTALAQIVAEELDVALSRVQMVMGDTACTPDEGYTAGSQTIRTSGAALRLAAAEARRALLQTAAAQFGCPVETLSLRDGSVVAGERHATYGELMGSRLFGRNVASNVPLKPTAAYHLVGTDAARTDLPGRPICPASSRPSQPMCTTCA